MTLLVAVVLLTTSSLFVASALNGLTSMSASSMRCRSNQRGVEHLRVGPHVGALLIGGTLSGLLENKNVNPAARISSRRRRDHAHGDHLCRWKPRSVFDNVRTERGRLRIR